jgi:hypothetical protein
MHFLLVLVLLFLSFVQPQPRGLPDNPSSIVSPIAGEDPGYIIAESDGGLANRLRVLAAYMYIGEWKFQGAHCLFVWDKNSACPGHFLSIFEPIPNVSFATNTSIHVFDKRAKIVYENSWAVFPWIMGQNGIPKNKNGHLTWSQIEYKSYSKYFPTREVMMKVNAFVEKYNICNCSAMHLRTTDLDKRMGERKRLNMQSFFHFVDSRPAHEPVYIMTDNPYTQRKFVSKYGPHKILFFEPILDLHNELPLYVRGRHDLRHRHPSSNITTPTTPTNTLTPTAPIPVEMAEDHRHTTLEHALIDVLIAAHTREFKPSPFSSLSELVTMLGHIGKNNRGWCGR